MTLEEINALDIEGIEARANEIREAMTAEDADLDALKEESRMLTERKTAILKEIEERKADVKAVLDAPAKPIIEERKKMTIEEIRSSNKYADAFARYIRSEDDRECRALLTDNVESPLVGSVPVPTFVEGIIADQLRASRIMSRVRKTYAKGNVKVGFELNAPVAEFHEEGGDPVTEENLQLGIVTLVPATIKKWVSISDEALDTMSGESYLRYLYSELGRKIIEAEEEAVISAILQAPQIATATAPAVAELTVQTRSVADFINARALLTSEASDLVIIMKPADYAAYKTLAISAGFPFDPFEGIEVLFSDYATVPIIGDLGGVLANYPNGDAIQYKYDDTTLMTSDLVRVLGRKPVAIGVVGNKYFAVINEQGGV